LSVRDHLETPQSKKAIAIGEEALIPQKEKKKIIMGKEDHLVSSAWEARKDRRWKSQMTIHHLLERYGGGGGGVLSFGLGDWGLDSRQGL